MKNLIKQYWGSTPKFWRKIGDSLLAVSVAITGYAIFDGSLTLAIIVMVTGVVGKFLTNLFSEK